jgi:hypothetical protein
MIDKKRLAELVRQHQREGVCSEELGGMVLEIAQIAARRSAFFDPEEVESLAVYFALKALPRIDPEANPFGYLVHTAQYAARRVWREWKELRRNEGRYVRGEPPTDHQWGGPLSSGRSPPASSRPSPPRSTRATASGSGKSSAPPSGRATSSASVNASGSSPSIGRTF